MGSIDYGYTSDFIDNDVEEPDINIIIDPVIGDNGKLFILVNFKEVPSELDVEKAYDIAKDLVDCADFLISRVVATDLPRSDWNEVLFDSVKGLALSGYNARSRFFQNSLNKKLVERRMRQTTHTIPVFHIKSKKIKLPWGFLFERDPREMAKLQPPESLIAFWALQSLVTHTSDNHNFPNDNSPSEAPIRIGVVIENSLQYAKTELEKLKKLKYQGNPVIVEVFKATGLDDLDFISSFNEFLSQDFHILHFACHAYPYLPEISDADEFSKIRSRQVSLQACFGVCDDRKYLIKHFTQEPPLNIKAPLVFLNACSTGIRDSGETFQFIDELLLFGARNIIAIETAVSSHIAEEIAIKFYKNFLQEMPLGMALQLARQELINNGTSSTDIMALCYSLHADENLKI